MTIFLFCVKNAVYKLQHCSSLKNILSKIFKRNYIAQNAYDMFNSLSGANFSWKSAQLLQKS